MRLIVHMQGVELLFKYVGHAYLRIATKADHV